MHKARSKPAFPAGNSSKALSCGYPAMGKKSFPVCIVSKFNIEEKLNCFRKKGMKAKEILKHFRYYVKEIIKYVRKITKNDSEHYARDYRFSGLAILLILGCCLLPQFSQGLELPITLEFQKGVKLSHGALDQLYPSAVTFDPIGREICVTESRGGAFHILNARGVEVFRTGRFADLRSPLEGSLLADGSLFFLDLTRDTRSASIRKLNLFGEPVDYEPEKPSPDWSPDHLVLIQGGNILTLDGDTRILAMHDATNGSLIWQREILDVEASDLGMGRPACAPDGRIFVPGGESHQVHVFSSTGTLLESFGKFGTGPAGMVFPIGVAFGPLETILVLDRMRHKILIFDSDFDYVTEVGQAGIWPGQFYHPLAIAASDDGRVYISQGFQSRVQIFQILFEGLK